MTKVIKDVIITYGVVRKDGKLFVKHTFNGTNYSDEEYMKIYGIGSRPYVRRMSERMELPEELIEELKKFA